jgi:hypothetical protein
VQTPIVLKLVKLQDGVFGVVQITDKSLYVTVQAAEGDKSFIFESAGANNG